MKTIGYPELRARLPAAPVHPNENTRLIEAARGRLFAGSDAPTGAGGGFAQVQLFNPLNSQVVVIVEHISAASGSSGNFELRKARGALATLGAVTIGLGPTTGPGFAQIRTATDAGATLPILESFAGTAPVSWVVQKPEMRLEPGDGVQVVALSANVAIRGMFRWREYPKNLVEFP